MKLKVLDLFSGIGGFSLGLERTGGFETAAFCEIDPKAQKVLRKHWPHVPIYSDVKEINGSTFEPGDIQVICGGFPCQDISGAGRGGGLAGARSGLWWEFHRIIGEVKPAYVIIENVSALRYRGLDQVLRSLSEIGYDAEWHCIPASAVGAPHQRDRIWIVAYPAFLQRNGSDDYSRECVEPEALSEPGDRGGKAYVAHPSSAGLQEWRQPAREACAAESCSGLVHEPERCCEALAKLLTNRDQWSTEPNVGRVAHGVPGRVDRLKQLGNAVVPQIPELIGQALLSFHQS